MIRYDIAPDALDALVEERVPRWLKRAKSTSDDRELRLRGLVTIAFFGLDDVIVRKNLMKERALIVSLLHMFLVRIEERGSAAGQSAALVKTMLASTSPHTNCARSFARLFRSEPAQAAEVAGLAETFLRSGSAHP